MTIEILFEKMSDPSQKRVLYGIYWAIKKMKDCGTKSSCYDNRHTFTQWISFTTAEYIIPKLDGFTRLYKRYEAVCSIDGDTAWVTYHTGMWNGNVRVDVEVIDTKKMKEDKEKEEMLKKKNQEILKEMNLFVRKFFKDGGGDCTDEEYENMLITKFGIENYQLYKSP